MTLFQHKARNRCGVQDYPSEIFMHSVTSTLLISTLRFNRVALASHDFSPSFSTMLAQTTSFIYGK
jgi:hypothetical protein